ncbi:aconitase family protein [Robbsia sp. KACC 23696]|uniref:aconitase family protein n=1 Tax=Robbsia sp. KACC 23696 TaxID=3149231 RepID=UPI00325AE833
MNVSPAPIEPGTAPNATQPVSPLSDAETQSASLTFAPRFLFLSTPPSGVTNSLAQPQPDDVATGAAWVQARLAAAQPLRDDISTDEITPLPILAYYDETLGRFPYTGFRTADGQAPIGADAVRRAGFEVVVAGKRYGKGSSREHSPAAERHAGVRLIVAESFERIYRQNADNIGLYTSTDFGLLARIAAGEAIPLAELTAGRDALTQAILHSGGLLKYGRAHLRPENTLWAPKSATAATAEPSSGGTVAGRPKTLFEKIVARHLLPAAGTPAMPVAGDGVFVRSDWRFIHEYYTGMASTMLAAMRDPQTGAAVPLEDPGSIVVFEDHTSYADESITHVRAGMLPNLRKMIQAQRDFADAYGLRMHRTLTESEAARDDGSNVAGISHAMMIEHYALPGQLVVGTDSHTPHSGAIGCVAFGVGTTDMANAFVTGAVRMKLPSSVRVTLDGALQAGASAKDIVLHLLALPIIRDGSCVGKVFEFTGSGVQSMTTDARATLTNMVAELGGFTGLVAPDAETVRFLRERRGIAFSVAPWMHSDADAVYDTDIAVDCSAIGPMLARPGDPGNGMALAALADPVRVDIAYGGSCTAGKRDDFDQYHGVLRWAADRGLRVAPHVRLFLQFGTTAVRDHCASAGYLSAFEAVGARMLQPSCGACGNCGPGSSENAQQVTISAINRNFPGRGGPGNVWLGSPATVAASAIAGEIVSFEALQQRYVSGQLPRAPV